MDGRRVLSRDEFVAALMEVVDDVSSIGSVVMYIEAVLRLQNDMSRPVYIFAVPDDIPENAIVYIRDEMKRLKVDCCLVPDGILKYVGEVDSESFGVRNIQADVLHLREGVVVQIGEHGEAVEGADGVGGVDAAG